VVLSLLTLVLFSTTEDRFRSKRFSDYRTLDQSAVALPKQGLSAMSNDGQVVVWIGEDQASLRTLRLEQTWIWRDFTFASEPDIVLPCVVSQMAVSATHMALVDQFRTTVHIACGHPWYWVTHLSPGGIINDVALDSHQHVLLSFNDPFRLCMYDLPSGTMAQEWQAASESDFQGSCIWTGGDQLVWSNPHHNQIRVMTWNGHEYQQKQIIRQDASAGYGTFVSVTNQVLLASYQATEPRIAYYRYHLKSKLFVLYQTLRLNDLPSHESDIRIGYHMACGKHGLAIGVEPYQIHVYTFDRKKYVGTAQILTAAAPFAWCKDTGALVVTDESVDARGITVYRPHKTITAP